MYNTKNYTEQGGDVTHIGGSLVFDTAPIANMATPASDANAAAVRSSLIGLYTAMKDAGIIEPDELVWGTADFTGDPFPDRAYNTGKVTSVRTAYDADGIIQMDIILSCKVSELKDFEGWGVHKWLGVGISVTGAEVTDVIYNGSALTAEDAAEAISVGLSAGYFVRWVAADLVLDHDNSERSKDTFTIKTSGHKTETIRLNIIEPEDA